MTYNVTPCQASLYKNKKQLFLNRLQLRSKAYKRLLSEGYNPAELYDWLNQQKKLDTIAYRLLKYVLFLASKNVHAFPLVHTLQEICHKDGVLPHEKSISRVTRILADKGIIRKWYRGFRRSVALLLNRVFNNPVLQYLIAPLFPFMAFLSFNIIYPTLSDCREAFVYRSICLFATDVTYNKYIEYINNIRSIKYLLKREILSRRGGFYNARAREESNYFKSNENPKKGMQSIGSVIKSVLGGQQTEVFSPSFKRPIPIETVRKSFVLPEQPRTVGELLALKFKEQDEYNSQRFGKQDSYTVDRTSSNRFDDSSEDESVWQEEDGDDYPGRY